MTGVFFHVPCVDWFGVLKPEKIDACRPRSLATDIRKHSAVSHLLSNHGKAASTNTNNTTNIYTTTSCNNNTNTNNNNPASLRVLRHKNVVALEVAVDDGLFPAVKVQHPLRHINGNPQPCPRRQRRPSVVQHLPQAASGAELTHDPDGLRVTR